MKHIRTYSTKTKWKVALDASGLPLLGYDIDVLGTAGGVLQDVGVNVLIHGSLMLIGAYRGRSAAHFKLYAANEWCAHMTMSGADKLFHSVANGMTTIQTDTWRIIHRAYGGVIYKEEEMTAPVFRGYWTVAKQGTEYSLVPAPAEIIP